jgi:hypothetical protein
MNYEKNVAYVQTSMIPIIVNQQENDGGNLAFAVLDEVAIAFSKRVIRSEF